jgi:cell wall-associated NlpC family hydrolase
MNCWELTRQFYKQCFDIELKHFSSDPRDRKATESLIYTNRGEFTKVELPSFGDIILIKILGIESHIAIYIGNGLMLHTSEKTGSVIDRTDRWVKTITGYYRPPIA